MLTTLGTGIVALDGPTLADAIPLDLREWQPSDPVRVAPELGDGWRVFVAELATAVTRRSRPPRYAVDPRTCCLLHLGRTA